MDFAPVLDTITNPDNTVIGNCSFGTDPELVWNMASQVSAGLKKHGFISMAAQISVPNVIGDDTPTSMSKVMLTDILRDDLGYYGVIITDALGMGAVSNNYSSGEAALGAFQAGADLLLMPKNFQEAYNAVLVAAKDGRISQERLDASIYRIGKMKLSR